MELFLIWDSLGRPDFASQEVTVSECEGKFEFSFCSGFLTMISLLG